MRKLKWPDTRLCMLAVILLAFALRVHRLGDQELRGDEAFFYFFSLRSFQDIIRATIELGEPHPVGSYLIEKACLYFAGRSEFAVRFLSAWFGVLAVGLAYRLGRRLGLSRGTAGLGAGLLAISPYAIWHSQDARTYSMTLALTTASTWLAMEMLERPRWSAWLTYVLVSWLALHVHYFTAFVLLAQNVFVLSRAWFRSRPRAEVIQWGGAQLVLALMYAPWLLLARGILSSYHGTGDSPGFIEMLCRSLSTFAVGEAISVAQRPLYALLGGVLLLGGIARLAQGDNARQDAAWLLALYLALPLGITWASARSRPIFHERYLVAAAPPFYLLMAAAVAARGLAKRRPHLMRVGGTILSVMLLLAVTVGALRSLERHYTDPTYSKTRGWRELAAAIERLTSGFPAEQVRIAENFPDPTLWYYYTGPIDHIVLPPAAHEAAGADREVAELVAEGIHWVLLPVQPSELWDGAGIATAALAKAYTRVAEQQVAGWPLQVYARPDPEQMVHLDVTFTNGLILDSAEVQPDLAVPGGVLVVHLSWTGPEDALAGTEKLFLHLVNTEGVPVAQIDPFFGPGDVRKPVVSYSIMLPETLSPSTYRLIVGIYDPGKAGAPRVLTVSGADQVQLAALLTP